MAKKGQAVDDFIAEVTYSNTAEVTRTTNSTEAVKATGIREKRNSVPIEGDIEQWTLYVDGASNDTGSEVGMMLISPEGHKIHHTIRLDLRRQTTRPNIRP